MPHGAGGSAAPADGRRTAALVATARQLRAAPAAPAAAVGCRQPAGAGGDPDRRPAEPALPPLIAPGAVAPRVISPQNAWIMDDMMADVIKRGTGIRAGMALHRNDISGKTGTTNEARDTWFNGFNRNIVATRLGRLRPGASAGRGRRRQPHRGADLDRFHARGAARSAGSAAADASGLVTARISPATGALAAANESDAIYETFMEDHLPPAAMPVTRCRAPAPQSRAAAAVSRCSDGNRVASNGSDL